MNGHIHTKVSFGEDYVRSVTKEDFVKEFKDLYPHLDLSVEYDKIVPPAKGKQVPEKLPAPDEITNSAENKTEPKTTIKS